MTVKATFGEAVTRKLSGRPPVPMPRHSFERSKDRCRLEEMQELLARVIPAGGLRTTSTLVVGSEFVFHQIFSLDLSLWVLSNIAAEPGVDGSEFMFITFLSLDLVVESRLAEVSRD